MKMSLLHPLPGLAGATFSGILFDSRVLVVCNLSNCKTYNVQNILKFMFIYCILLYDSSSE